MNDPMLTPGANDPRYVWIGYPHVASPDRFVVPDDASQTVYLYVPLDAACRFLLNGLRDGRRLELRFHPTPEDDARLVRARDKYVPLAKRSLRLWDHEGFTPRKN